MFKIKALVFAFAYWVCVSCHARDILSVDVNQATVHGVAVVDHLTPVTGLPRHYYLAQIIVNPAHQSSWKLVLAKKPGGREFLISLFPNGNNSGSSDELDQAVMALPSKNRIAVSEKFATSIYKIWVNTLYESRFPKGKSIGLDGTTYIFSSFVKGRGWLAGSVWSPSLEAPPKWLVEIGLLLRKYVESTNDIERQEIYTKIEQLKNSIYLYMENH